MMFSSSDETLGGMPLLALVFAYLLTGEILKKFVLIQVVSRSSVVDDSGVLVSR